MRFEGSNGSVEYFTDRIVIRRKGFANVLTQGVQGDKTIPISRIMAVQFKAVGSMSGLIQFTVQGGREFRGGMMEATKDENAVMFTREQGSAFAQLRVLVESAITASPSRAASERSEIDDLAKLAELHEKGYLTKEEFEVRKKAMFSPLANLPTTIGREPVGSMAVRPSAPFFPEQSSGEQGIPWWSWILLAFGALVLLSIMRG